MVLSHAFGFVFIKTMKTAGTSIEAYLSPHCGADDVLTPLQPPEPGHRPRNDAGFRNHMPAHEVRARIGADAWDRAFSFCVERNPWEKALSHFHMLRTRKRPDLTFARYVAAGHFPRCLPRYAEPGTTTPMVDEVLHYEHLDADLARTFARLGVPFPGVLSLRAKGDLRSDRRDYREVYTPDAAARVGAAYAEEIALFGYRFDEPRPARRGVGRVRVRA